MSKTQDKGYVCQSCGRLYAAIQSDWVRSFDAEGSRVLWRCPNCGRLQKDAVHYLHDEALDYKPGRGK